MTRSAGDHRRFEEDLAAYLLGSLDQTETITLETHLARCERCRSELDWLRPAAGALAASVPQLVPPRRLRRRTLAAARAERRRSRPRPRRPVALGAPRFAMLAGALTLVAIGIAIAVGSLPNDQGPGASTVAVQPAEPGAAAVGGRLIVRDDLATLEVHGMPRLPSSQVYEAWVDRNGDVAPSSTFIVDRRGVGATTIPSVEGADRVMVTREPRGGSDRPTTAPLLLAPL
jgi:hypothetical protein